MGFIGRTMNALGGAYTGFVEAWLDADPARPTGSQATVNDYGAWNPRRGRYDLHWSMYRNNTYRNIKSLAQPYKGAYGLYRHTRGCYSPSRRIVDFCRTYLMGGTLDPAAGDGREKDSALPIELPAEGADEAIRPALARLWWDSHWAVKKGVLTLWGPVLGDVFLQAVDDRRLGRMRMEVIHPGTIAYLQKDDAGETLAYQRRQMRPNPELGRPTPASTARLATGEVEYMEEASIEGGRAVYRTYRNTQPYDWSIAPDGLPYGTRAGAEPEWDYDADFLPLYHIQHIDEGLGWGCSELEGGRIKIDGINDVGSKLHDQIRRAVEGAFLFTGMSDPAESPITKAPRTRAGLADQEPGRQQQKAIYTSNENAKAQSLVGTLDIADTSAEIRQALDSLEDDYPELRFERLRRGGTLSGEALRVAQGPAANKIEERRPTYDYAIAQAQMAALAIGGQLGYEGYEGFNLASYSARKPTHRIGARPVFATSPAEKLALQQARFQAIKTAVDAGMPLAITLADLNYSKKDIDEVIRLKDAADARAHAQATELATAQPATAPPEPEPKPEPKAPAPKEAA